jgi:phosphopantetheinyl transferase
MSVEEFPELLDHCLIPQAAGWPHLVDRRPTAPMTMLWELMADAVRSLRPGHVVCRIEDVTAYTWLEVEPAFDLEVSVEALDDVRFRVTLGEYATGTVVTAPAFPAAPEPAREPLTGERPAPIDPATAYRERWLFHGPRYQGLHSFGAIAEDGMRGRLISLTATGGLLDSAGQLYGLWIATHDGKGRVAMPLRIRSVAFYGPEPPDGELVDCWVWIRQAGNNVVRADLELAYEGRVYVRIEGWEDWLFETEGRLYPVYRFPERNLLAQSHHAGFVILDDPGWLSTTLDFLTKRYLSMREREAHPGIEETRRFPQWLRGRIAAKDAVRRLLYETGHPSLFPAEVEVLGDDAGRPVVETRTGRDIRVSIAHKDNLAVAIANEGSTPGIDVERIEARGEGFEMMAFYPEELALLPDEDRAAWVTRLWSAKEAAGKATGNGLSGNPKTLQIRRRAGERLLVEDRWVETTVIGEYVIAWTSNDK